MLTKTGIHLNQNGTMRLANNFCYTMNACRDKTCMDTRKKPEKQESAIAKKVNKNSVFNVNSSNTDRPVNPTVDNNKSLSRNNTAKERDEIDVFPSVTAHRLQNAKNVTIGALNVNSLRNKIGAVQELITNNIDICLLSETKKNGSVLVLTNHHQYENVILIGHFNLTVNNKNLEVFMNAFNIESLINKPTCFQQ